MRKLRHTFVILCLALTGAYAQPADTTTAAAVAETDTVKKEKHSDHTFTIFGHKFSWPGIFHRHPDSVKHAPLFGHYKDSVVYNKYHLKHLRRHHSGVYHAKIKDHDLRELFDDISEEASLTFTYVGKVDINTEIDIRSYSLDYLVDEIAYRNGMLAVKEQDRYIIYGQNAEDVVQDQNILYTYNPRNLDHKTVRSQASNLDIRATIYPLDNQNALLLKGTLEEIKDAITKFRIVDDLPRRVSIELLVVEYNHGEQFNWGFDVTSAQTGRISEGTYNPQVGTGFTYNFLGQLTPDFKVNLSTLVGKNYANVVTNPHLVTTNNEKATIDITERRYVQLETASINGITTNLQNVDAGISLDVTPMVMTDGNVKLTLKGKNSVFLADETQATINTLTNTIDTEVTLRSGETLIIGGLIQADEADGRSGVPILRNIPILNLLFSGISKEKNYLETVIYITTFVEPMRNEALHKAGEEYDRLQRRLKSEDKKMNIRGIHKVF